MMKINTKYFGEIEIDEKNIITFPKGVFAFEDEKRFLLIFDSEEGGDNTFMFLQSVDTAELCFVVADPSSFAENGLCGVNYAPAFSDDVFKSLALNGKDDKNMAMLVIAVIYEDIQKSTVNLMSPVVINTEKQIGMQIILDTSLERNYGYKTKQPIFVSVFDAAAESQYAGRKE